MEGTRFSLTHLGFRYNQCYWDDASFAAVERLAEISAEIDIRLSDLALAWVLSNKTIASIVCGATTVEHLKQNIQTVDIALSLDVLDNCDAVLRSLRPPRLFYGR